MPVHQRPVFDTTQVLFFPSNYADSSLDAQTGVRHDPAPEVSPEEG